MLLTIDIGNTNITLGLFAMKNGRTVKGPVKLWRLSTNKSKTADEYGSKIMDMFHYARRDIAEVKAVAIASVVPTLNCVFEELADTYFGRKAFFIEKDTAPCLRMDYDNPGEVGADRIADAVAAYAFFGGPVIVLDFGTATTFDCIGPKGEYLGGAIAPGPHLSARALTEHTAKLPQVNIVKPARAMGKSTVEGMQSGLYFGYVGLIKEILGRLKKEMKGNPKVIATGGLAAVIVPDIREVKHIVPELTLEGIRLLWEGRGGHGTRDTGRRIQAKTKLQPQ